MDLTDAVHISAAGMKVQTDRLKVVSQNIANAESVGTRSGQAPYRRQTIEFRNALDRETKLNLVQTKRIGKDTKSDFDKRYEPNNPNADGQGYVLYPNVNPIMEMADMREARRGYEANLNIIEASKAMMGQTINLLK
jgi:flagellar basal-body rod protein FlgC